jgi:pyruvate dehydrogenase E2 component (dihydrolipoamide acetyltransferase)
MSEFTMPSLGADMESAVLMEWRVKEGEHVTKGQVIAEVETSKGVIEIEVFEEGIIEKLLVAPDTECAAGTPLAIIRSEGENKDKDEDEDEGKGEDDEGEGEEKEVSPSETASQSEPPAEPLAETAPQEPLPSASAEPPREVPDIKTEEFSHQERVKASPAARKKASQMGIDLADIAAETTGVIQLKELDEPQNKKEEPDGMRQAIAKAMSRSNAEIPHYYLSMAINMTPALEWLEELNSELSIQERILPAALLIRAAVKALQEVPQLNGYWRDNTHQLKEEINPGIAISLRKGGLITPALIDAQNMDLKKTMQALGELISRTRTGKLRGSEMTQQSITITNLGDLGVERVYGVIYPPQLAIIGFGRISDAPWAQSDTLSVRKVLHATLSGDHRATDGHTGALFLNKLDQLLQNPKELL